VQILLYRVFLNRKNGGIIIEKIVGKIVIFLPKIGEKV